MKKLQCLPFLRLLIFLCVGILIHLNFPEIVPPRWIVGVLFLTTWMCVFNFGKSSYRWRWLFGSSLALFLTAIGILRSNDTEAIYWDHCCDNTPYIVAEITESPTEKRSTYAVLARLFGNDIPPGTVSMLYIAKDSLSKAVVNGDLLLFPSQLVQRDKEDAPSAYETYLRSIGCSGTIYLPRNRWIKMGSTPKVSLLSEAKDARKKVVNLYEKAGISGDELAILSALTLGDKSQLSQEVKASYATTGASHILAVSGLHVGIVYLLIISILGRMFPGNACKGIRIGLTILVLWGYAFITGLSASVVRASVMLTLVAIGEMIGRRSITLNTVFAAAFCMLLYHPRYLTEVGFQLSFTAVLSILIFQERIYKIWIFKSTVMDKIWSLTSVSIAAQLGTLPIVLYHFHRFSNCFWLSGLVVIPLATLLLYTCVALIISSPIPTLSAGIGWLANLLAKGMNASIRWMEELPSASVEAISFNSVDVLFLYAILGTILATMQKHSFRRIALMLSTTLLYASYQTLNKWTLFSCG